jgi:hypothetical protein
MLMPRAQSIAIYDRMGLPVWLSDGHDAPELHRLMQDALSGDVNEADFRDGFCRSDRSRARGVRLPDARRAGALCGAVGLICRESSQRGEPRPFSLVQGLLRPRARMPEA